MSLSTLTRAAECLRKHPERKFKTLEIANWIFENYPDECREKQKKSKANKKPLDTDAALIRQIAAEVQPSIQKRDPRIKIIKDNPKKHYYYYTEFIDNVEVDQFENLPPSVAVVAERFSEKEHNLYPILIEFLWYKLGIYSKRIDEKRSRNSRGKNGNENLHPDIVGMEDLSKNWLREIKDCAKHFANKKSRLYSFEVKRCIELSNVRRFLLQTVSNSSWANFGYLVASEIKGKDTLKELEILSNLHGIGFIKLDIENPHKSQIIIHSKEREYINWDTVNHISSENKDFLEYVNLVCWYGQTGRVHPAAWGMSFLAENKEEK